MILVAIPAHDCRIHAETVRCLTDERLAAHLAGVEMGVVIAPGCSVITHARNQLVCEFLESRADRLVFVDSDVSWEPGALLKVALSDAEIVGGCYRYKDDVEGYPVGWLDRPELWSDPQTGLLEVASLPGGFLAIGRTVFEKLASAYPDRRYPFHGRVFNAYFHIPPGAGEDGAFCKDWRDIGGRLWLYPEIEMGHHDGSRAYRGSIGRWLRSRIPQRDAA